MSASVTRTLIRVTRGHRRSRRDPSGSRARCAAPVGCAALKAARAEELLMDPPAAGRSCRPGAKHGRPQRQGRWRAAARRPQAAAFDVEPPRPCEPLLRWRGIAPATHNRAVMPAQPLYEEATMTDNQVQQDWRSQAACRTDGPRVFFPEDRGRRDLRTAGCCGEDHLLWLSGAERVSRRGPRAHPGRHRWRHDCSGTAARRAWRTKSRFCRR